MQLNNVRQPCLMNPRDLLRTRFADSAHIPRGTQIWTRQRMEWYILHWSFTTRSATSKTDVNSDDSASDTVPSREICDTYAADANVIIYRKWYVVVVGTSVAQEFGCASTGNVGRWAPPLKERERCIFWSSGASRVKSLPWVALKWNWSSGSW